MPSLARSSVADALRAAYPELAGNAGQYEAVGTTEGPVLIIAGPGSGKTFSLVLRTMNLLLAGNAEPGEILLSTFTEKAAYELRDRVASAARKVDYDGDLSDLRVGTIHGLCNDYLLRYRHRTRLGNAYTVLDDLTQQLFINDHAKRILGEPSPDGLYLGKWKTKWRAISGVLEFFNKMAEELVDPSAVAASPDAFTSAIGQSYRDYSTVCEEENVIDFAHLQVEFLKLLDDHTVGDAIASSVKYVMVDEYQDTNYVQERLLFRLAEPLNNICVVGDEDQALYRFRGATVRNILEFPDRFPDTKRVTLSINYRSHKTIIDAYDRWMGSWDWSNAAGADFRFSKKIQPEPDGHFPNYPAVFAIYGQTRTDEARRFADMVAHLKQSGVIEDYSQVALLLHSVRLDHSGPYIDALAEKGIAAFCPRARGFFENEEIRLMIGCLALILGWHGEQRGELYGRANVDLADYVDHSIVELAKQAAGTQLADRVQALRAEVGNLEEGGSLDRRVADFFYQLVAEEPFHSAVRDENRARNLAILSQLLNTFQAYYHFTVITHANREWLPRQFFDSFLRLLHEGGINEYEDPDQPFPKGYVQVMTIHQSKGLEFPVVAVDSLTAQMSTAKATDRVLGSFYHRPPFEPPDRITGFDRMRQHYVAFSRAEKVLVLTTTERPKDYFAAIWDGLPQWPYVEKDLLSVLNFRLRERIPVKKTFSFTGDLKVYETCPKQYELFRYYDFTPSRSAVIFFGLLVHQTIEDIHRRVLEGELDRIDETLIRQLFESNVRHLTHSDVRPVGYEAREAAFTQVMNYFRQNRSEMHRVIDTEVDVSVEKEDYILTGKIDLMLGGDGKLELLDFKAQKRPTRTSDRALQAYIRQLQIYGHILERRYGKRADRLLLYWTGEPRREDALMEFEYRPQDVDRAGKYFDGVVSQILARDFAVKSPPEAGICKECDFRTHCIREGTITYALEG